MAKGRKSGKSKARKAGATATVRLRFANEGAMAKKKNGGRKKGSGARRGRKKNPGRRHHRRRNPSTFVGALGHLVGAGAVALATGAATLWAQNKWAQPTTSSTGVQTPNNMMLYGIPVGVVGLAALLAKKAPTIAVGMATGAIAGPFALPAFSKVQSASTPSSTAAAATHGLSAVQLGQLGWVEPMSAVELGSQAAYSGY